MNKNRSKSSCVVSLNKLYKREMFLNHCVAICWNVNRILLACSWLYTFITNSLLILSKRVAFINTSRIKARQDINEWGKETKAQIEEK